MAQVDLTTSILNDPALEVDFAACIAYKFQVFGEDFTIRNCTVTSVDPCFDDRFEDDFTSADFPSYGIFTTGAIEEKGDGFNETIVQMEGGEHVRCTYLLKVLLTQANISEIDKDSVIIYKNVEFHLAKSVRNTKREMWLYLYEDTR